MRDEEHHVHDLVAAYVLGAVTPDEASLVEEHLATCSACRHLEDELREVAALLPVAAGEMAPPPALKARVMAAVRAEARGGAGMPAGPAAPGASHDGLRPTAGRGEPMRAPPARPPGAWRATLVALAAVIAVVVVGVGVWRLSEGGQPGPTREYAVRGTAVQTAIAGSLLYFKDGTRLELDVHGLEMLPAGRVYELWLIRGHYRVVTGIGTLRPAADGTGRGTWRGVNPSNYTLACLTVERAPGAKKPTMPLVAIAPINA